ncbi:MAG: hypothetical protein IPI64_05645 [Chloracidobacterium sp.]|nr:hypothetical protein [Chloracidobacterium sp.]
MFNFKCVISTAMFVLVIVTLVSGQAWAQALFPIKGGTGNEPDPKDKGYLVLVAENSDLKITLRHSDKFKPRDIWALFIKVENKTDKPLTFDTTKFGATDDEGRALSGLEASVAIQRLFDATAGMGVILSGIIAGPFMGPSLAQASERGAMHKMMQMCIQSGEIPPHTFKDGVVFFEKAAKKTKELKVNFTGLWSDPVFFSTEAKLRLRATK